MTTSKKVFVLFVLIIPLVSLGFSLSVFSSVYLWTWLHLETDAQAAFGFVNAKIYGVLVLVLSLTIGWLGSAMVFVFRLALKKRRGS
jgi:hypothetical protein